MVLWVIMAVLAAGASLSLLVPLYRGRRGAVADSAAEVAIYKDQLGEIDRDVGRGLIAEDEAGAARTEIARRLLRADASAGEPARAGERPRRAAAAVAIVAVPALALGLYLHLGSPGVPDQPLAARLDVPIDAQDLPALIARLESHLTAKPEDGRGWELIAPVYLRSGRNEDARRAYVSALRLLGPSEERESGLGDAIVRLNEGVVIEDARAAFARANALNPAAPKPRFFLALALTQEGRAAEATAAWQALLRDAPADAPWVPAARSFLAHLGGGPGPSPSATDVDAASKLSPEQRTAMIEGMVGQLAARLESEPGDAEGWARLIRSYMVLGRKGDAEAALVRARGALASKADRLAVVETEARSAGLIE